MHCTSDIVIIILTDWMKYRTVHTHRKWDCESTKQSSSKMMCVLAYSVPAEWQIVTAYVHLKLNHPKNVCGFSSYDCMYTNNNTM